MSMAEQQAKAPADLRNVVNFLRSSKAGIKTRVGVLNGKRIDYFKGKSAVKALQSPAYAALKKVPPVTSEQDAVQLLTSVLPFAFYLRVDRPAPQPGAPTPSSSSPKQLLITQQQAFTPADRFAWFYEGSQLTTYAGGVALVAIMLAGVMFPLWPHTMRVGVSYLSMGVMGLVGLFFAIAIVRLIFWMITIVVAPPGIWIFPQLFADVGFVDSFIPLWEWDIPKKKGKKKKAGKGKAVDGDEKAVSSGVDAGIGPKLEGGAQIEEVPDSGSEMSAPKTRATVEDAPDED